MCLQWDAYKGDAGEKKGWHSSQTMLFFSLKEPFPLPETTWDGAKTL